MQLLFNSGGSDGKASDYNAGDWEFEPWVGKIPRRRQWQPTPVFLPGKSHGQRTLMGCSPWGHRGSHTTKGLSTYASLNVSGASQKSLLFVRDE